MAYKHDAMTSSSKTSIKTKLVTMGFSFLPALNETGLPHPENDCGVYALRNQDTNLEVINTTMGLKVVHGNHALNTVYMMCPKNSVTDATFAAIAAFYGNLKHGL